MSLKDSINDQKKYDYYSEKYNCSFKLKLIEKEYILFLHLYNLPEENIVRINWSGTKKDYKQMLDCIENYTMIDIISLFLSVKNLINKVGG